MGRGQVINSSGVSDNDQFVKSSINRKFLNAVFVGSALYSALPTSRQGCKSE